MNETESVDQEEVGRLHKAQGQILRAFRAKYGLDVDQVGIDIRNLGNGRFVWEVRKLSKAEREARYQTAISKDAAALAAAEKRTHVYVPGRLPWWKRIFTPAAVYLSEKGAREAGGGPGVIRVEVRA